MILRDDIFLIGQYKTAHVVKRRRWRSTRPPEAKDIDDESAASETSEMSQGDGVADVAQWDDASSDDEKQDGLELVNPWQESADGDVLETLQQDSFLEEG